MFRPSYMDLYESGELDSRIKAARALLSPCRVCPRQCEADREAGETGVCRTGSLAVVSSYNAHFGEEDPLVGRNGSGTIFFANCNLLCLFCQNYEISHLGEGREVDAGLLARVMLHLQEQGCHNINFVTPSHVVPQILEALPEAIAGGLKVPLVYNSGGYDSVGTLRLLDGVTDIYMPDFKFWDAETARRYCGVEDYPQRAQEAVREMHRQTGDLALDEDGVALSGLLVRHLVMPNGAAGTKDVARWLADEISTETYINIMGQYRPCGRVSDFPELSRALSAAELNQAREEAREAGLWRLDQRRRRFMLI